MKFGLSSCSSNSTIPIELSCCSTLKPLTSGLLLLTVELLSRLRRLALLGAEVGKKPAGPGVVTLPRAKLTVLTWESSFRALLSILAAASELEKRAGSCGRWRRGVLLKNSGLGGWSAPFDGPGYVRPSRLYVSRGFSRGRLTCAGWSAEASGVRTSEFRFFLLLVERWTVNGGGGSSSEREGGCDVVLREAILMLAARVFLPGFRLAGCWLGTSAAHVEDAGGAAEPDVVYPEVVPICVESEFSPGAN